MKTRLAAARAALLAACLLVPFGLAEAQEIKSRSPKFAFQTNPGTAQYDGAKKLADLIAEKSGDKIKVKLFPGGTLGGDLQTVSSLQGGTVEMLLMNASLLVGLIKDFVIFDFPYLFETEKEAYAIVDGPIGKKLFDKLPEKGLVGLSYPELGYRHVSNSKRAINKLEDFQGLKIRVIQTPIYIDFINSLGSNAVPLPFPEVYNALEQKTVDGTTNPLVTIPVMKFDEVQKYLSLTKHMYNPQAVLVSKKFWDQLSADEKKIFQEAAVEARDFERKVSQQKNAEALESLKKTMQVNEVPAAEIARLREKAKPVIDKYAKEAGEPLVKELYAEIEKVRGK